MWTQRRCLSRLNWLFGTNRATKQPSDPVLWMWMWCDHGGRVSIFDLAARRSIQLIVMGRRDASSRTFILATPPQIVGVGGNSLYSTNYECIIWQVPIVNVSVVTLFQSYRYWIQSQSDSKIFDFVSYCIVYDAHPDPNAIPMPPRHTLLLGE